MQLFGGMTGARAVTSLPLALRKKLVARYVASVAMNTDAAVAFAGTNSPFYRQLYRGRIPPFHETPIVTQSMLAETATDTLLAQCPCDSPVLGVRSASGAPGYLTTGDLLTMGAAALLHPDASALLAALKSRGFALNALPYDVSLLGPAAERLVRYLGGCGLQAGGLKDEHACEILCRERPSVIIAPGDSLARWLGQIEAAGSGDLKAVVNGINWWLRTESTGPMAPDLVCALEVRWRLRVIQVLSDGFSFLFLNCGCGQFHPGGHQLLETVDDAGRSCTGPGRVVLTDLARKAMPLVRYDTGLRGVVRSDGCPYLGQTRSVTICE
jgi:hypothetical protein